MLKATLLLASLPLIVSAQAPFDIVVENGRVMDPDSGLDAVRHVGIRDGKIAAISEQALQGKQVLDASGHVVTAGFIDLHQHGQSPENYRAQIHDGITSALELEIGVEDISAWYAEREGKSLVNHGASISHHHSRNIVMTGGNPGLKYDALTRPLTSGQLQKLKQRISRGLDRGAVAVGFGLRLLARSNLGGNPRDVPPGRRIQRQLPRAYSNHHRRREQRRRGARGIRGRAAPRFTSCTSTAAGKI